MIINSPAIQPADALATGDLISLSKAAPMLAVDGRTPSPTALWRFAAKGVLVNGERVKLPTLRLGRRTTTTAAAVALFKAALAQASAARADQPAQYVPDRHPNRTESRRNQEVEAAVRRLEQAGI